MEFPSQNANIQNFFSSENLEEHDSPRPDPNQSNEETNRENNSYRIPQPLDDQEYGCKYCVKKFSNKQALGGHQNAHKVERAMEKSARDQGHETQVGYFGGNPSYHGMNSSPFVGSFYRSHDFMNAGSMIRPYTSQNPMHHGVHIGYYAHPGPPMVGGPYGPRHVPGLNDAYSGWALSAPRAPQFMPQPSYLQIRGINSPFPILDSGSSSARFRHDGNLGGENNNQVNDSENPQVEDSDLDLSLKL